jgi:uncharacterized protein (TIGR02145 family)
MSTCWCGDYPCSHFYGTACSKKDPSSPNEVEVPELTTSIVSDIEWTSAQCGGTISSDGGDSVIARGVCWSVGNTPTTTDYKTTNGSGIGDFSSVLSGLQPGTDYHVRAYAINSAGTGYGEAWPFRTLASVAPTLTSVEIVVTTPTQAECSSEVTAEGGAPVLTRGFCYSFTNPTPTIDDNKTVDGSGPGVFSSQLYSLLFGTTYYVRAYATNSAGTGYGEIVTFDAGMGTVTDVDGNTYRTVLIGSQWWMAENLRVTHYRNGELIPNWTDSNTWLTLTFGARCYYDNNSSYASTYGILYNGYAVNDARGIAPAGWHVPTDAEWKQLEMYLGMSQTEANQIGDRGTLEGGKLKEVGTTHWESPNSSASDEYLFTALPGGRIDQGFSALRSNCWFWASDGGYFRILHSYNATIYRHFTQPERGISIRCLKD